MQQFPCSFEFNEGFLLQLARHSYSSQFGTALTYQIPHHPPNSLCLLCNLFYVLFHPGTFLGNSEAERQQMQLSLKTVSLWSHLNRPEMLRSFLNPLYEPNNRVIWPSVAPMSLVRLIFLNNRLFYYYFIQYFYVWGEFFFFFFCTEFVAGNVFGVCSGSQCLRLVLARHIGNLRARQRARPRGKTSSASADGLGTRCNLKGAARWAL